MMVVAPLGRIRALIKRWHSVHVPNRCEAGGYDVVVNDLAGALDRAGIQVQRRRAHWAYELPGRILAVLGGEAVSTLVPTQPRSSWGTASNDAAPDGSLSSRA